MTTAIAKRPTAVEKLADPLNVRHPTKLLPAVPPVEITKLTLRGKKLNIDIVRAVTGGEIERTIEGACTLTLTVHDPKLDLLKRIEDDMDVRVDRFWFRLARVTRDGSTVTLVFEDREVAWLRGYTKPRRAYRDKQTRAEFVLSMVREVREGKITLVAPELHKRQRIGGVKTKRDRATPKKKEQQKHKGIASGANLKIKGDKATPAQLKQVERALDVATSLKGGELAMLAELVAGIGESGFNVVKNPKSKYAGVFQADPANIPMDDTEQQARYFLIGGKGFQGGGALALAKGGRLSAGAIATKVEASGEAPSFYDKYLGEAKAILKAYTGESLTGRGTHEVTVIKRYAFTRGTVNKRESSWDAMQRLAEEVGWRAFMVEGVLYFISEEDLLASKPRFVLNDDSPGVKQIDFELDRNLHASQATVLCRAELWEADPGSVIELDTGVAQVDGRWLVASMSRGIWDKDTTVTLKKPMRDKGEPAPETDTASVGGDTASSGSDQSGEVKKGKGNRLEGGSAYDRLYAACEEISAKAGPYLYAGGHGPKLSSLSPASRMDCSSSTSLALYMAGLMPTDVAQVSGWFASSWGKPGAGKHFTVVANDAHVFIELYGREKQRFDTGQHPGSGPRLVKGHRSDHGGRVARHWPGE